MPRALPWKVNTVPSTANKKGKARAEKPESGWSDRDQTADSSYQRKRAEPEESDHQDDENWRMTESELAATAKFWTRDLHQQAYEKLFQVQQREFERSKTLTDLLDQPLTRPALPPLPARIPDNEPVAKTVMAIPDVTSEKDSGHRSVEGIQSVKHSSSKVPMKRRLHEARGATDNHPAKAPAPSAVPKLSEAALARRRKREQERQTDSAVVPLF